MSLLSVMLLAGAMFLNRTHFDLIYHVIVIGAVIALQARREWGAAPETSGETAGDFRWVGSNPVTATR